MNPQWSRDMLPGHQYTCTVVISPLQECKQSQSSPVDASFLLLISSLPSWADYKWNGIKWDKWWYENFTENCVNNTLKFHYNMVNFLQNTNNRHLIAGYGLYEYLLRVESELTQTISITWHPFSVFWFCWVYRDMVQCVESYWTVYVHKWPTYIQILSRR